MQHFAFPPAIDADGQFVTVKQGSADDILGTVLTILRTPQGWFDSVESLGRPPLEFGAGVPDAAEIHRMVERYEPRVRLVTDVELEQFVATVRLEARTDG